MKKILNSLNFLNLVKKKKKKSKRVREIKFALEEQFLYSFNLLEEKRAGLISGKGGGRRKKKDGRGGESKRSMNG